MVDWMVPGWTEIVKAAEIYLKAKGAGIVRTITDEELQELAKAFNVRLNRDFLNV